MENILIVFYFPYIKQNKILPYCDLLIQALCKNHSLMVVNTWAEDDKNDFIKKHLEKKVSNFNLNLVAKFNNFISKNIYKNNI